MLDKAVQAFEAEYAELTRGLSGAPIVEQVNDLRAQAIESQMQEKIEMHGGNYDGAKAARKQHDDVVLKVQPLENLVRQLDKMTKQSGALLTRLRLAHQEARYLAAGTRNSEDAAKVYDMAKDAKAKMEKAEEQRNNLIKLKLGAGTACSRSISVSVPAQFF